MLPVAKTMMQCAEIGIKGRIVVTHASQEGARVVKVDPPFRSEYITFRDNV